MLKSRKKIHGCFEVERLESIKYKYKPNDDSCWVFLLKKTAKKSISTVYNLFSARLSNKVIVSNISLMIL